MRLQAFIAKYWFHRIRIHTTIERFPTLEGVVILINTNLHVVAFAERPPSTNHHIFALSALKDFELLPKTAFPLPRLPPSGPLAPLDTEASLARANAAVAKMKEKIAKRNPSVTKEAQEIFDAIGRQYPTRWEGKDIIIMDQVIVRGPGYKPEDCRAGKDVQQGVLTRVKKVVSIALGGDVVFRTLIEHSLRMSASASLSLMHRPRRKVRNRLCQRYLRFPHSAVGLGRVVE